MNGWLHAFTQASHCTGKRERDRARRRENLRRQRRVADEAGAGIVYSELASHNYAPRACPRLLAIPSAARNLFV